MIRRIRPDVLLVNNGGYPGGESCRVAVLAARRAGVGRVVHFVHNMAFPPAWPVGPERRLDQRIDLSTDRWITAAHRASDELSAQRGIPRSRIDTVYYGVAVPPRRSTSYRDLRRELGFTDDQFGLVAIANLEPRKGISVLLTALARLRGQAAMPSTAIVGRGPMKARLEAEVRALGLCDWVRFLGWREDVDAILDAADGLVLPSLTNECLPYVILEAMAHRLPVVATNVAGIPEMLLDGTSGLLVAAGDADGLASAIAQLSTDRQQARQMGEHGWRRVRDRFSLETMVAAMSSALSLDVSPERVDSLE
jgi:glycosyltransferase involved in cell wall biosynthesis